MSGGGRLAAFYKGFTLAEVLVTLGIIGVVSAMTIPTLMQNHQRKTYVIQLRKIYSEVSQALILYQTQKNAVNLKESGINSTQNAVDFVKSTFKVITDCGSENEPCFAADDEYKKLDGTKITDRRCESNHPCFALANGASVSVHYYGAAPLFQLIFDINGQKGPNIAGRDFFSFYIYNNGVIDDISTVEDKDSESGWKWDPNIVAPLSKELREENFQHGCMSSAPREWHGCFGKILNDNWEMNY